MYSKGPRDQLEKKVEKQSQVDPHVRGELYSFKNTIVLILESLPITLDQKIKYAQQFTNKYQVIALKWAHDEGDVLKNIDNILKFSEQDGQYQIDAFKITKEADSALKFTDAYSVKALEILSGKGVELWGNNKIELALKFANDPKKLKILEVVVKNKQNPADALKANFGAPLPGAKKENIPAQFDMLQSGYTVAEANEYSTYNPPKTREANKKTAEARQKLRLQAIEKGLSAEQATKMETAELEEYLKLVDSPKPVIEKDKEEEGDFIFPDPGSNFTFTGSSVGNTTGFQFYTAIQIKASNILDREGVNLQGHNKADLILQFTEQRQVDALEVIVKNKQNPADALEVKFDSQDYDGSVPLLFQLLQKGFTVEEVNLFDKKVTELSSSLITQEASEEISEKGSKDSWYDSYQLKAIEFQINVLLKDKVKDEKLTYNLLEDLIKEAELCDSEYKLKAYKLIKLAGVSYSKEQLKQTLTFGDEVLPIDNDIPDIKESPAAFKKFFYNLYQIHDNATKIDAIDDGMQKEIFNGKLAKEYFNEINKHNNEQIKIQDTIRDREIDEAKNRLMRQMSVTILAGVVVEAALITTALAVAMPPAALIAVVVSAAYLGAAAVAALAIEGKSYADRVGEINKEHNAAIQKLYTL